jgi:hypothetical protein
MKSPESLTLLAQPLLDGHKASGSESAGTAVTAILVAAVTLLPVKLIGSGYSADGKGGRIKYNAVARGRFL